MSTKDCPSCGAEVPASASRCKDCFHDFEEAAPRSGGPIFLLAAVAAMAVVGALTLFIIVSRPLEERILVDEDTHSVVWTKRYRTGVETERLNWDEIGKIQYVVRRSGKFEIVAVTTTGERRTIQQDTGPLKSEAQRYAKLMEKPLDLVDETTGFHKTE